MLAACKKEGPSTFGKDVTRVADITSKAENDFVANIIAKGNRAWIGAKRDGNGEWKIVTLIFLNFKLVYKTTNKQGPGTSLSKRVAHPSKTSQNNSLDFWILYFRYY